MADDRPRPTENDNQDADGETPRDPETDSEVRPTTGADSETDAESAADPTAAGNSPDADVEEDVASEEAAIEETTGADADSEEAAAAADDAMEVGDGTETDADATGAAAKDAKDAEDVEDTEDAEDAPEADPERADEVPADVRKYARFKKMDGAQYDRVNEFLRDRTYITAREWAIARLCADFRTETGVEMTKIGENLPELVPFMTDTYTPQAVNQARTSFEEKVRQAGATFLYGAMSGFFTAEELDDMMYEVTEVAKFLLEVEGVDLSVEEELEAEDRISSVMREVQSASEELRHDELACPNCGHEMEAIDDATEPVEGDD